MSSDSTRVLAYQGFVERWCQEEDAVFRGGASAPDIRNAARRLGLPRPRSSTNSQRPAEKAFRRWSADWDTIQSSRIYLFGELHHYERCPWCQTELSYLEDQDSRSRFTRIERRTCNSCGWWDTDAYLPIYYEGEKSYRCESIHRRAILKEFDVSSARVPVADLAQHLVRYPQSVFRVEPYKLEELVGSIFNRTMDCTVQWLGGPGDGGIDLLLVRGEGTYAVQVKRKAAADHPIRVALIREFVGAMHIEGITKGVFVTTSSFTKAAKGAATRATQRPGVNSIDLVDGRRLVSLCGLTDWSNTARAAAEAYVEPFFENHLRNGMDEFHWMGWR